MQDVFKGVEQLGGCACAYALIENCVVLGLSTQYTNLKGNGAVYYKDLNLARASRRAIYRHVTC